MAEVELLMAHVRPF